MLNDRPSRYRAMIAAMLPIVVNRVATISATDDNSRWGKNATPYIRKVPAKAEIRGSQPSALFAGGVRKITIVAISQRNNMLESRAAICSGVVVVEYRC